MKNFLIVLAFLAGFSSVSKGDYLTQNWATGYQGRMADLLSHTEDHTFAKFDQTLGYLDSVTLTLNNQWQYVGGTAETYSETGDIFTWTINATASMAGVTDSFFASESYNLGYFERNSFGYAGLSSVTGFLDPIMFYGNAGETVDLTYSGISNGNITNDAWIMLVNDTNKIELTYNYTPGLVGVATPEPGSLGLCAVGLGCVFVYFRRK